MVPAAIPARMTRNGPVRNTLRLLNCRAVATRHGASLPNGSRLKPRATRRQGAVVLNDSSCPPGHNTPLPLRRSVPTSFKRLLDGPVLPRYPSNGVDDDEVGRPCRIDGPVHLDALREQGFSSR